MHRNLLVVLLIFSMIFAPMSAIVRQAQAQEPRTQLPRFRGPQVTPPPDAPNARRQAAQTPAPVDDPLPAAQGESLDARYIPADANFVSVSRPRVMLESPAAVWLPIEVWEAAGKKYAGVDINTLDSIITVVVASADAPPSFGAVVRFTKPYDRAAMLAALRAQDELFILEDADDKDLFSINREWALRFVDSATLIYGDPEGVSKMMSAEAVDSPIVRRLRALPATDASVIIMTPGQFRPQFIELARQAPELPPPLEPLRTVPELVSAIEMRFPTFGELSFEARIYGNDEASAQQLASIFESTIQYGVRMADAFITLELGSSEDEIERAFSKYLRRLLPMIAEKITPAVEGDCLTLRANVGSYSTIAAVGVGVALLLPAVQSAREAARRSMSSNNMKQLTLAMHNYHDAPKELPPRAIRDAAGKPLLSWRVALLPALGEEELYNEFRLDEPWDSEHNIKLLDRMPAVFHNPNLNDVQQTNYLAIDADDSVMGEKGVKFHDVTDGLARTIVIVEANAERAVPWTKPEDLGFDEDEPLAGLGDLRPKGFLTALADGSIRMIPNTIDPDTVCGLVTKSGGENIEPPTAE